MQQVTVLFWERQGREGAGQGQGRGQQGVTTTSSTRDRRCCHRRQLTPAALNPHPPEAGFSTNGLQMRTPPSST